MLEGSHSCSRSSLGAWPATPTPGLPLPTREKEAPPGVPAVITERTGGKCSTWPLTLCFDKFRLLLTVPGRHTAPAPRYREARLPPAPTGPPRAGAPGPEQTPPTAGDKQPRPSPLASPTERLNGGDWEENTLG